jgi:hypothetical protein
MIPMQFRTAGTVLLFSLVSVTGGVAVALVSSAIVYAGMVVVLVVGVVLFAGRIRIPTQEVGASARGGQALHHTTAVLLVALGAYELSFNYLGNGTRLGLAGLIALALTLLGLAMIGTSGSGYPRLAVFLLYGLLFAFALIGGVFALHSLPLQTTFRSTFPLVVAAGFLFRPEVIPLKVSAWIAGLVIVGGTAISFSHGQRFLYDATRLSPFTGGTDDGLHTSSLLLATAVIVLNELRRQQRIRTSVALPLMALAAVDIVELKVATAIVMLATYLCLRGMLSARTLNAKVALAVVIAISLGVGYNVRAQEKANEKYGLRSASANSVSSGRLSAWSDRVRLIDSRSVGLLLVGSGIGSDHYPVTVWAYKPKDSHNDFLTVLIEQGILGLSVYVAFLVLLAKTAGPTAWPVIASLAATSAVSNAMFARPMIAPFLWLAAGIATRQKALDPSVARKHVPTRHHAIGSDEPVPA